MNAKNLIKHTVARHVAIILLTFGAVSVACANTASGVDDEPKTTVYFTQRSLGTDFGALTVYHRIVAAAELVCPRPTASPFVPAAIQVCRDRAVARAVHDINSPRLVALHATSANHG